MRRARILLADDHPPILEVLKALLEPQHKIVGAVTDGKALLALAQQLQPDVIISDIDMPLVAGIEAAHLLKEVVPDSKVIFLTAHNDPSYMAAAFAAGAAGYLVKGSTTDLFGSLRTMIAGLLDSRTARDPFFSDISQGPQNRHQNQPRPAL